MARLVEKAANLHLVLFEGIQFYRERFQQRRVSARAKRGRPPRIPANPPLTKGNQRFIFKRRVNRARRERFRIGAYGLAFFAQAFHA
jgi:hypothetical protein